MNETTSAKVAITVLYLMTWLGLFARVSIKSTFIDWKIYNFFMPRLKKSSRLSKESLNTNTRLSI